MKRHPVRTVPRLHAPGVSVTQHEGGGFTIQFGESVISGHGVSLDAAWKAYKSAMLDYNAAEALKLSGKKVQPTDHVVERKRIARRIKKTVALREEAAKKAGD